MQNVTVPGTALEAVVTGLDISSKNYSCLVTALNVAGSREASSNSFTTLYVLSFETSGSYLSDLVHPNFAKSVVLMSQIKFIIFCIGKILQN